MPDISHLSLPLLLVVFAVAAAAVWIAGIYLSGTTDALDDRWHLGEALGGLILLAVTTNLPEIAITVTAALHHDIGVATGNILGGIALQTVVLVALDVSVPGKKPLTWQAASLVLVLEGVLVTAVLVVVMMGTQLPKSLILFRVTPEDLALAGLWLAGLWLLKKAGKDLPWQDKGDAPGGEETGAMKARKKKAAEKNKGQSTAKIAAVFGLAALVTLAAGVALEQSSDGIARHLHMTGVLFAATVLAAATSLPELSTGITSIKSGDYSLAISDIFGGNAFLPVLFLPATLLSGQAVLPQAQRTDIYLAGLGVLLTAVYVYGLVFRPNRLFLRMGVDSLVVLVLYAVGVAGLFAISAMH
jgi:cation:H+ antiporter